jgi:hypothetical protein
MDESKEGVFWGEALQESGTEDRRRGQAQVDMGDIADCGMVDKCRSVIGL